MDSSPPPRSPSVMAAASSPSPSPTAAAVTMKTPPRGLPAKLLNSKALIKGPPPRAIRSAPKIESTIAKDSALVNVSAPAVVTTVPFTEAPVQVKTDTPAAISPPSKPAPPAAVQRLDESPKQSREAVFAADPHVSTKDFDSAESVLLPSAAAKSSLSPAPPVLAPKKDTDSAHSNANSHTTQQQPQPPPPPRAANTALPPPPPPAPPSPQIMSGTVATAATMTTAPPSAKDALARLAPRRQSMIVSSESMDAMRQEVAAATAAAAAAAHNVHIAQQSPRPATGSSLSNLFGNNDDHSEYQSSLSKSRDESQLFLQLLQNTHQATKSSTDGSLASQHLDGEQGPSLASLSSDDLHTKVRFQQQARERDPDTLSLSAISSLDFDMTSTSSSAMDSQQQKLGSWSSLASALSEIALSNKLREHLTLLKDEIVAQAHAVGQQIHLIHDQQTQHNIKECLQAIGHSKNLYSLSEKSIFSDKNDIFLKTVAYNNEVKLTWDDLREVLSLRTLTFQQKSLSTVTNKTERDFLLNKISQTILRSQRTSMSRHVESALQTEDQFVRGQEQLLMHRIAFVDEKLHEFSLHAVDILRHECENIASHYREGWNKRKEALALSFQLSRKKHLQAMAMVDSDGRERQQSMAELLKTTLEFGSRQMQEILTEYQTNANRQQRLSIAFAKVDEQFHRCYRHVYEKIEKDEARLLQRPERRLDEIIRMKRAAFEWKRQHAVSMEDRLHHIQDIIEGYLMSLCEDLSEEVMTLQQLDARFHDYDKHLTRFLNVLYLKENSSSINAAKTQASNSNPNTNSSVNATSTRRLDGVDLNSFLKFQTLGPTSHRQNIFQLGTHLRAAASLAGLSHAETIDLMQQLLSLNLPRRRAIFS